MQTPNELSRIFYFATRFTTLVVTLQALQTLINNSDVLDS